MVKLSPCVILPRPRLSSHNILAGNIRGALLGGLIGNQFGSGHGREIATAVGALAGAGTAQALAQGESHQYQLVELLIRDEKGKLINVIQDYDAAMALPDGG